ncbi:hypothetical protein R1flu_026112 [Riccia fluitans]|uniref:Uncharacterized protein n=1 Tax=Riccia fluitans TaxID=41844 RepID=A0ABD1XF10_9MARC
MQPVNAFTGCSNDKSRGPRRSCKNLKGQSIFKVAEGRLRSYEIPEASMHSDETSPPDISFTSLDNNSISEDTEPKSSEVSQSLYPVSPPKSAAERSRAFPEIPTVGSPKCDPQATTVVTEVFGDSLRNTRLVQSTCSNISEVFPTVDQEGRSFQETRSRNVSAAAMFMSILLE